MESDLKTFLKSQGPYFLLRSKSFQSSDMNPDYTRKSEVHFSLNSPLTLRSNSSIGSNPPYAGRLPSQDQIPSTIDANLGKEQNITKKDQGTNRAVSAQTVESKSGEKKKTGRPPQVEPKKQSYDAILGKYSITKKPPSESQRDNTTHEKLYTIKDLHTKNEAEHQLKEEITRSSIASKNLVPENFENVSLITPKRMLTVTTKSILRNSNGEADFVLTPDKIVENGSSKEKELHPCINTNVLQKNIYETPKGTGVSLSKFCPTSNKSLSNIGAPLMRAEVSGILLSNSFRTETVNKSKSIHKKSLTRTGRLVTIKEIASPTLRINIISAKGNTKPTTQMHSVLNYLQLSDRSIRRSISPPPRDSQENCSENNLSKCEISRAQIETYNQTQKSNHRQAHTNLVEMLNKQKYSDLLKSPRMDMNNLSPSQPRPSLENISRVALEEEKKALMRQIDEVTMQTQEYLQNARARLELLEEASSQYSPDNNTNNTLSRKLSAHGGADIERKASHYRKPSLQNIQQISKNKVAESKKLGESLYDRLVKKSKK